VTVISELDLEAVEDELSTFHNGTALDHHDSDTDRIVAHSDTHGDTFCDSYVGRSPDHAA